MSENKVEVEAVKDSIEEKEEKPAKKKGASKGDGKSSVESIITSIEKLTVLELVDLVKALEQKFGVSAAAPVSFAGVSNAQPAVEAQEAQEEKSEFTVVLTGFGDKKIQVIKVIREITGLGLKEAKDLVDNVPGNVKEGIPKEEAERIKKKIEEVGGSVNLK